METSTANYINARVHMVQALLESVALQRMQEAAWLNVSVVPLATTWWGLRANQTSAAAGTEKVRLPSIARSTEKITVPAVTLDSNWREASAKKMYAFVGMVLGWLVSIAPNLVHRIAASATKVST
jgi:hypothetical protein